MKIDSVMPSNVLRENENSFYNSKIKQNKISFLGANTVKVDLDNLPEDLAKCLKIHLNAKPPSALEKFCEKVSGICKKITEKIFRKEPVQMGKFSIKLKMNYDDIKKAIIKNRKNRLLYTNNSAVEESTDNLLSNFEKFKERYNGYYSGKTLNCVSISRNMDYSGLFFKLNNKGYLLYVSYLKNGKVRLVNEESDLISTYPEDSDRSLFKMLYPKENALLKKEVKTQEEYEKMKNYFDELCQTIKFPEQEQARINIKLQEWEKLVNKREQNQQRINNLSI